MNEFKKIEKIRPEVLLTLVREELDLSTDFVYLSGEQPFFMSFKNIKYYVYVKNISSAYFSDRDRTTRAQLPIKPEFDLIKSSPFTFIFLGYDGLNDVFVCWNYHIAKERLNVGKSVSFYSRTFFQSEVKHGEFLRKKLKNGDVPVLFKRSDLIEFFNNIDTFFAIDNLSKIKYTSDVSKKNLKEEENYIIEKDEVDIKNGRLLKVTNIELLKKIEPYLKSNRILSAAQLVGEHYQNQYPKMKLTDWIDLVRNI